jgi:hypothetical protein
MGSEPRPFSRLEQSQKTVKTDLAMGQLNHTSSGLAAHTPASQEALKGSNERPARLAYPSQTFETEIPAQSVAKIRLRRSSSTLDIAIK